MAISQLHCATQNNQKDCGFRIGKNIVQKLSHITFSETSKIPTETCHYGQVSGWEYGLWRQQKKPST
jgi:hypothetical protein